MSGSISTLNIHPQARVDPGDHAFLKTACGLARSVFWCELTELCREVTGKTVPIHTNRLFWHPVKNTVAFRRVSCLTSRQMAA